MDLNDNEKEYTPINNTSFNEHIYSVANSERINYYVNCWRKADILISNNHYIVALNNLELDIEHREEIQRVKTDNVKMLENKHNKL
jgi:hypothetical protein